MFVKTILKCFSKKKEETKRKEKRTSPIGTNVKARVFNVGLLAKSQFASGRSCDQPTRSRFSVVFVGPRANAELIHRFHVALHASHAAHPMITLKISYICILSQIVITLVITSRQGNNEEQAHAKNKGTNEHD
jgi:hypothetical protein